MVEVPVPRYFNVVMWWGTGTHFCSYNSLRALVDKNLRTQVIKANQSAESLRKSNVTGEGHEYWVDASTGFSQQEQDALIKYLLTLK